MQKHVRNGVIYKSIKYYLLYNILQVTVLFDMYTTFALGALHNFQISYGE